MQRGWRDSAVAARHAVARTILACSARPLWWPLPPGRAEAGLKVDPAVITGLVCLDCHEGQMTRIVLTLSDGGSVVERVSCQSCD